MCDDWLNLGGLTLEAQLNEEKGGLEATSGIVKLWTAESRDVHARLTPASWLILEAGLP